MSLKETPMLHRFWKRTGGTLIEEFVIVNKGHSPRYIDGIIIKNGENKIKKKSDVQIEGQDIIIVQVKAQRLGMPLMGQTLFSMELMKRFNPKTIEAVALCKMDDEILSSLLKKYPGMKVVVDDG
jgi:hypothetical protein